MSTATITETKKITKADCVNALRSSLECVQEAHEREGHNKGKVLVYCMTRAGVQQEIKNLKEQNSDCPRKDIEVNAHTQTVSYYTDEQGYTQYVLWDDAVEWDLAREQKSKSYTIKYYEIKSAII